MVNEEHIRAVVAAALDDRLAAFERRVEQVRDGLLDRAGAAEFLSVSLATLDRLCTRPDDPLPVFGHAGEGKRFRREDLLAWVNRQQQPRSAL